MENENKGSTEVVETKEETSTGKTYTEEELQALLQAEGDRRVSQALKKQEAKYAAKMKESEKLARMNEQEKYAYQLEQREAEIAERERQLSLAENKAEAVKVLADKGLNISLVDFVVADDADTMKSNIDLLEKAFKASVKAEVEKRLASSTPKKNFVDADTMTKEKFNNLSMLEQQRLINENPDLINLIK